MKYKLMKCYEITFMNYTNCMNDTVRHNNKDMTFLDVGKESFIVKESDIEKISEYGGGIRDATFVGNILVVLGD